MAHSKSRFARPAPTRSPKKRFLIYCEGKNTEPQYFDALRKMENSALIDLELLPSGVPRTVAEKAITRAKEEGLAKGGRARPKNSFESHDQVWAVFDRDEHDCFEVAIELCARHGVHVGRSNPCFEVWLILHAEDFDRPDDRHQVCRHLRSLHPAYDPNSSKTCDWFTILPHIETAEKRAVKQLLARENEGDPFGPPSTTVGALSKAIREAANNSTP